MAPTAPTSRDPSPRRRGAAIATVLSLALLAGCATGRPRRQPQPVAPPAAPAAAGEELRARLLEIARSLLATPYRYAGSTRHGFDCSGFTSYVFARAGRRLPRTAQEQAAAGRWVALDEARAGDLLFFGERRDRLHHVGMVISDPGEPLAIIHASKSRGVVETDVLASTYWLGQLQLGRRVLD